VEKNLLKLQDEKNWKVFYERVDQVNRRMLMLRQKWFFYNKFGYGIKECIIKFVTKTTSKKLSDSGTNNDKLQVVLLQMKVVDLIGIYYVDVIQNIPYDKHKPNKMWGQTSQIYKNTILFIHLWCRWICNQPRKLF
jgi:hypothetical protein